MVHARSPHVILLMILTGTQVFSSLWLFPGLEGFGASLYRVFLAGLATLILITYGFRHLSNSAQAALLSGSALVGWMTFSLFWSVDPASGIRQIFHLTTILACIYVLDHIVRARQDFQRLAKCLILVGVGVTLFAFYELQTGNHFPSSILLLDDHDSSLSYVSQGLAWFTFGNPNDLAAHLSIVAFVASIYLLQKSWWGLTAMVLFATSLYLSEVLHSRLILSALIAFAVLSTFCVGNTRTRTGIVAGIAALVLGAVMLLTLVVLRDQAEFVDLSSYIRLELLAASAEMSTDTWLVGVGVGAYESTIVREGFSSGTYGILSPHNAFGRMLAENGIIGLGLFCVLLFGPLFAMNRDAPVSRLSAFVISSVVVSPLLFSAGSDPISASSLGLWVAITWVAAKVASDHYVFAEGENKSSATPVWDRRGVKWDASGLSARTGRD